MATRDPFRRRARILIWLEESGAVDDAWVEHYAGGDRVYARGGIGEPFDTPGEVLAACLSALDGWLIGNDTLF